jgi:hypothetical protein
MTVIVPVGSTYTIRDSGNTVDNSVLTDTGELAIRTSIEAPVIRAKGRPWFDVTAYGAGSGGTTDQVHIDAAIADAVAAGGGVVFFPAGIYHINDAINVDSLKKVTLTGAGAASQILQATSTKRIFTGSGGRDVTFQDLFLGGTSDCAIVLSGVRNIRIARCIIEGSTTCKSSGILINGATTEMEATANIVVEDCQISSCGTGGSTPAGADIAINPSGDPITHVRLVGNRCLSTGVKQNILCADCSNLTIEGNECSGASGDTSSNVNGGYGIVVYTKAHDPIQHYCHDIVVANNRVSATQGNGIYLQNCQRAAVTGNQIHDVASTQIDNDLAVGGISCSESTDVSIAGNTITTSGRDGIVFSTNSDAGTAAITGNTVTSAASIGIHLRGPASRVSVVGNTVVMAGGHGISAAGTANVISGNDVRDSSQSTLHTYSGINVDASYCVVDGNCSGGSSQNYGIVTANGTNCLVTNNEAPDNTTDGFSLGTGTVGGNYNATTSRYEILTNIAVMGAPASGLQLDIGSSGVASSLGVRYSGKDAVWAMNARQTPGSDLWTQNSSLNPSWLALMDATTGGMKFFTAPAGKSPGSYAAFWGSPVVTFRTDGVITANSGTDADSVILTGGGGGSPSAVRSAITGINPPSSASHLGQAILRYYRNSVEIVSTGVYAGLTGAVTGTGDYAWTFAGSTVAAAALTSSGQLRTAGGLQSTADVDAAGGYRRLHNGWAQTGMVAASQTDVPLADSVSPRGRLMTRAGSVTALAVNVSTARSAGTLTVLVQKSSDGGSTWTTISASCAISLSTSVKGAQATFVKDTYAFAAGDLLRAIVTANPTWAPTANDLDVAIEVEG